MGSTYRLQVALQVLYDDGAQETVNFSKERWKLLEREAEGASGGESKSGDKEAEKDGAFTAPGRKEPDGKHVTGGSGSVESAGGRGSYVYTVPQPHQARRKRQGDSVSPDVPEKRCRRKVDEQRGVPSTSGDSLRRKEQPGSVANGGMGCMASARPATPLEGLNLLTFVGEHWGLQLRDAGDDLRGFEGGGNEAAGSGGDGDKSGSDTETAVGTTASKAVVCLEVRRSACIVNECHCLKWLGSSTITETVSGRRMTAFSSETREVGLCRSWSCRDFLGNQGVDIVRSSRGDVFCICIHEGERGSPCP